MWAGTVIETSVTVMPLPLSLKPFSATVFAASSSSVASKVAADASKAAPPDSDASFASTMSSAASSAESTVYVTVILLPSMASANEPTVIGESDKRTPPFETDFTLSATSLPTSFVRVMVRS